jgi:fructose-specific phosphotransferase system IIC component
LLWILLIAMPLAMDKSSKGIPIMLVVRKRKGYITILAMTPPNAPSNRVLTILWYITEILHSKISIKVYYVDTKSQDK